MSKKNIGGQAVIEGVMMKSPSRIAIAVRTKGKIIVKTRNYKPFSAKHRLLKIPVVRGAASMLELLIEGINSLSWSAKQSGESDEALSSFEIALTIIISLVATVLIFIIAPYYLAKIFIKTPTLAFNLIDGIFRVGIFILYLVLIGKMKDIRRVFQYHGAEHKAVHCYEASLPLTPENCQKFSTKHPRCGTSLLVFVIIVSILLFSLIKDPRWYVNIPLRIVLIPAIAGISYELLKISAKFSKNKLLAAITAPGLWTQKLTTRNPTRKQLEVAIAALKKVI